MKREALYQSSLIKKIYDMFPSSVVLKNDANYIQGFPDLLVLYKNRWAALETKRCSRARKQPNQEYYIGLLNEMSYANFVSPENEKEVLDALQQTFESY